MHPPVPNPIPGFDYPQPNAAPAPAAPAPAPAAAPAQQPDVGGPVQGPPSPGPTRPANPGDIQLQDKNYQAAVQTARNELDNARQSVLDIQTNIDRTRGQIESTPGGLNTPAGQQLQQTLNTLYTQQANANVRVATAAESFATIATKAIDSEKLTDVTADKARADADAAKAQADHSRALADQITKGSPAQIALASNQAAQAAAAGRLDDAQAGRIATLAPAELNNPQAQNGQLKAQTSALQAQADKDKQAGRLTSAQADIEEAKARFGDRAAQAATESLEAQAAVDKNKVQGLPTAEQQQAINQIAVQQAQAGVGLTTAQAKAQQASAAAAQAGVEQKKLGPTYGLQDQIDQIKKIQSQVFGPGGSGNPADADALLRQFTTATLGGTTIQQAAQDAATAQQNQFQTQMTGVNALQAAQASRANQFASTAGSALGQLAQMNQYAPKGSTAMAGAFRSFMDEMAGRLAQPQFGAVQLPQAPDLPQFMQAFTMGHRAATATAQAAGGGGQTPTVNINLNGQPANGYAAPVGSAGGPSANFPGALNMGYATPPSAQTQPATQANMQANQPQQTPQQAFTQGLANAPSVPAFAQNYVNLPNPMSMIGFNSGGGGGGGMYG